MSNQGRLPALHGNGSGLARRPYTFTPGPKTLLTLYDAEHGLSGISGYDVAETTDENPERVAAVGRLTWAYLHTELPWGSRLPDSA